jgi:hypothetical protein
MHLLYFSSCVFGMEIDYPYFFDLCKKKSLKSVKRFLHKNRHKTIDINHQNEQGATVFLHAAEHHKWNVVGCLLRRFKNANIMLSDKYGQTLFSKAVYCYAFLPDQFKKIVERYSLDHINSLSKTICFNKSPYQDTPADTEFIADVLMGKRDVHNQYYQGMIALSYACIFNYIPCTIKLVECGAPLDIKDAWGDTSYDELAGNKASFFVVREAFNSTTYMPVALINYMLEKSGIVPDVAQYIKELYIRAPLSKMLFESPKARIWQPVCVDACAVAGINIKDESQCLAVVMSLSQQNLTGLNVRLALGDK